MTTRRIAANLRSLFSQWRWGQAMACCCAAVFAVIVVIAYIVSNAFSHSPQSRDSEEVLWQSQRQLLRYSAHLTSQSLNEKQRLLDAYAYTLGLADVADVVSTKQWLYTHGEVLAKVFEETWLVALPSSETAATDNTALKTWRLRPGQAAVAQALPAQLTQSIANLRPHQLSASVEITYWVERNATRVVHTSPALSKQGVPTAVLIGLMPLQTYLSAEWMSSMGLPSDHAMLHMPLNSDVLGPFITNREGLLLASPAGHNTAQLHTVLRQQTRPTQPFAQAPNQAGYAIQWQSIAGTSWLMGLATPAAAEPLQWSSQSDNEQGQRMVWAIAALSLAATVVFFTVLCWLLGRFSHRSDDAGHAHSERGSGLGPLSDTTSHRQASHQSARSPVQRAFNTPASSPSTTPLPLASQPSHSIGLPIGAALHSLHGHATPLCLNVHELEFSSQCLVVLHHGKIQSISQGTLDFLKFTRTQLLQHSIESLLALPQDYKRLRILQSIAAHDTQPLSCTIEIVDAQGYRHVVCMQVFKHLVHGKHQHLVLFEPIHAQLARLCAPCPLPHNAAQLEPTTHLPTFPYWRAIVCELLTRKDALETNPQRDHAQSEHANVPHGFVLYIAIDGFSSLTSTGGEAFSDEALRYTANAISHVLSTLGHIHLLGHLQHEQFVLACTAIDETQAFALGKQLQLAIASLQASYQGAPIVLSISVGMAALPDTASALDAQLRAADLACFDAASKGIGGLEVAKPSKQEMLQA